MQKTITFVTSYSLIVSLLYLYGFWGTFDVNILEYIALSDVVKNAIYPLMYSSIFVILGFTIGNILSVPAENAMPPGGGKDLPEAKYVRWFFRIAFIFLIAASLYLVLVKTGNSRWLNVAVILIAPLVVIVGNAEFASEYIRNKRVRVIVVNILCIVVMFAFGWGGTNAEKLKSNNQELKLNGENTELKYIGWAGDFLFLWNGKKNSIVIKQKSEIKSIEHGVPASQSIVSVLSNEEKPNKPN